MDELLLIPIGLPILAGVVLLLSSFLECRRGVGTIGVGKGLSIFVSGVIGISAVLALTAAWQGEGEARLFSLLKGIPVYFRVDEAGRLFVTLVSIVWLLVTVYALVYMKEEKDGKRFFGFWLLLYGVLVGLDFAGNLVTMYFFYEMMTLASVPLVLHDGSRESIMAALKYLFYSLCGAYGGLFGIFFLYRYCDSLTFVPGGTLNLNAVQGQEGILLTAVFVMILGFGVKAGMLPFHAWLPTAHPVAPSPASAVLSSVIVKSGVLALLRAVFYIVGTDFLRGTWVQYGWMILSLLTVFVGSLLAFREKVFKKRLAYSTVSQVSYILFGLSLFEADAMTGAFLHVVFHAFVKCGLFLTAGIFLHCLHRQHVEELGGIGKRMPVMLWSYTLLSLALVGIPPACGFISKWYLGLGALQSETGIFSWMGPVILLVSALLTAGYLLPVSMKGFFPGKEGKAAEIMVSEEETKCPFGMLLPVVLLGGTAILAGIFPNPLIRYASDFAGKLLGMKGLG